jgi:hypothetical protein
VMKYTTILVLYRSGLLALLMCCGAVLGFGQTTGALQGTALDQQSAVVAGAKLELTASVTNTTWTQITGAAGTYFFNSLPPGTYTLKASLSGFKTSALNEIIIGVNRTTTVDIHLELGTLSESVKVSADAERIDVATAQVGTNVNAAFVRDLPNFSRNTLALAQMAPGVDFNSPVEGGSQVMNIVGQTANVNGNHEQRNNFYLDGVDNAGSYRNNALQFPNPDAVQEVQVSTSNTSAEMGRQVGGVFNVVTKSGTNQFHGDAFYFFREKELDANSWDRNRNGLDRADDPLKQVGGVLGGPVRKNKTFFFLSFMRYSNSSPGLVSTHDGVTSGMANGDLSPMLSGANPIQLIDPDNGAPLANNQVPASLIDPVGKKFMSMIPPVNTWGQYYVWQFTQPVVNHEWMGKIDHHWNDQHTTSFSLLRTYGAGTYPATNAMVDGDALNTLPGFPGEVDANNQWTISARHTAVLSANLIAEGEFGLTKQVADRGMSSYGTDLTDMGAQNFPTSQAGVKKYMPGISVGSGIWGDGVNAQQGWLSLFDQHNYHLGGKLTWIKGSHSIKFGGDAKRDTVRQLNPQDNLIFNFDGRFSGGSQFQSTTGASYADLLMGRSTGFSQTGILDYNIYNWAQFYFVEDTWKVNRKLTLTPGLRYEFYLPAHEMNGKATAYMAGYQSTLFPDAPVGLAFPGDPGVPTGFFNTEWKDIAPRLGVAYDVKGDGKWAIRGGVGKYYSYNATQVKMLNSETSPWQPSASCPGATMLSNPWLDCTAVQYTKPPTPFTAPGPGTPYPWPSLIPQINGYASDFKTPYNVQWNVALEHEIARQITVSAGYVGNIARDMTQMIPINWARWAPDASQDGANILSRQPNQGYNVIDLASPVGKSSYNSLQTVLNIRRSDFNSTFTYVLARGFDNFGGDMNDGTPQTANPQCLDCERAETVRHHTFRGFYSWDMPFLRANDRWLAKIAGGWQLSGTVTIQSGTPSNVTIGQDWNYDGVSGDRPDLAGSINYVKKDLGNGVVQWIDVGTQSANSGQRGPFALPTDHSKFGNLVRNAIIGPGYWSTDAALMKSFHLTERQYFQVRVEAQDLLNHAALGGPDLTYFDSTFGQSNYRYGNRLVQVGLKYYF